MNGDLISREALLEFAHNHVGGTIDCNDIARFPAVDAAPVVHSEWIKEEDRVNHWHCKKCGLVEGMVHYMMHYCPNCGAKMDLEGEHDD